MNTVHFTPSSRTPIHSPSRGIRNAPRTIGALLLTVAIPLGLTAQQQRPPTPQAPPAIRETLRPPGPGTPPPPGAVMPTPPPARPAAPEFRSWDGRGNNRANATWGSASTAYLRETSGAAYADGVSAPAGARRPSARVISNALSAQGDAVTADPRGLSTAIYEFGQFLDHDLGLAQSGSGERFDIAVPKGDVYFDPKATGTAVIPLTRSASDPSAGTRSPRQQVNGVTAFIDASHIYGSSADRAAWLRTFSGGRLKSRSTALGELLPLNDGTQSNDNPLGLPATALIVAGDVRANEQPGLTTLHTVFLREHNLQAARLATQHPDWNDERLYQEARRWVTAEFQSITVNEFLPALLGHRLPPYKGYNPRINPGIGNTFATAAYRFGHSQVGPDIGILNEAFVEIDNVGLAEAFFNPQVIPAIGGIDPIVRYMAANHAESVDTWVVDPLRNFLFGPPGAGGLDLAALNIQRGRDHGLGSYNTVRSDFGLPRVRSFRQITSDPELAAALQSLYRSVDEVDAWIGLLSEDPVPGGSVGITTDAVITDQFRRLRDGDRFWYENAGFDPRELAMLNRVTLGEIVARNSTVQGLQPSIFFVRQP